MSETVVTDERRERALVRLARAAARVRATAGCTPLLQLIAQRDLRHAEDEAQRCQVLVTEEAVVRSWRERAWSQLIDARHDYEAAKVIRPPLTEEERAVTRVALLDAVAVAKEWGVLQ